MDDAFEVRSIGRIRSPRPEPIDDGWGSIRSAILLDDRFDPRCLAGLDAFSHIEVVYLFDRVRAGDEELTTRRPRNRADWPEVGIFAQRARRRPNRLGVSVATLLKVDGLQLEVEGLDAIDGTPVLDLKPYLREFAPRGPVHQPAWSSELMARYW